MEKLLSELLQKVEQIKQNQEIILSRLDKSIIYPQLISNPTTKDKKSKKEKEEELHEELVAVILHSNRLREKFNLAVTPQSHRVLAYLKTGKESAFDGLKRRK